MAPLQTSIGRLSLALVLVATLAVAPVAAAPPDHAPPHEGHDGKLGPGSDDRGHGNNCDGDDADNGNSASPGLPAVAMEHRNADVCPEDERY